MGLSRSYAVEAAGSLFDPTPKDCCNLSVNPITQLWQQRVPCASQPSQATVLPAVFRLSGSSIPLDTRPFQAGLAPVFFRR